MNFSLRCHLCGTTFPATALWVCDQCLGPLEVTYDYAAIAPLVSRALIESRPKNLWRYREFLPIAERTADRPPFRLHAARPRRPSRQAAGRPRALRQGRFGQSSDLLLQGPRRLGRRDPGRRARVHRVRLRVDRQPRQQRRLARGAARPRLLGLHPRRPRARQGHRRRGLPSAHHRRARQLRRRQPAVHAGGGSVSVGLREHQPARLLRRGRQDLRLRDRRTARLALPAPRRVAGRRRHAAAAHPQGIQRAARGRAGRRASCRRSTPRRPPAARRSSARSRKASSFPSRSSPTRSPSRSRSAIRPTASRCCARCARPAARARWSPTTRSIDGIQLLAETEGIFTEPAGGVTVAATRKLIEQGAIHRDESIVICITGNGYKTAEVMNGRGVEPIRIGRSLAEFEAIEQETAAAAAEVIGSDSASLECQSR